MCRKKFLIFREIFRIFQNDEKNIRGGMNNRENLGFSHHQKNFKQYSGIGSKKIEKYDIGRN